MLDFSKQLMAGLKSLGIEIGKDGIDRLELYFTELKKWSKKINLIAKTTDDEQIVENHFLDSLTILPLLRGASQPHLLDIGTGAGFPGLVCKSVWPELAVTLVEPRLKRVSFLKHIVRTLELEGVRICSCRIEDEQELPSDQDFSHITCRAVTDVGQLLQMAERFSSIGLTLIYMKGPKWKEELAAASAALSHSSFELTQVVDHALHFSGAKRSLLVFSVKP